MRILFISDVYFPRVNGVSTSLQTFKRGLESLGHEVYMIVPDYGDGGVDVPGIFRIASRGVLFDPEDRMMKRGHVLALEGTLKSLNIDVIHVHTPFVAHYTGVSMARRLGLPCVESYHTFFEEYLYHYVPLFPSAWMRNLARRFSRSQCNAVDAVIVPSTPMRDVLLGYGVKTNMVTLPTGLELERFCGGDGARFRRRFGIPAARPMMLHVGRVAFEKNIDFLLRVVEQVRAELPEVLFVIAGEGPARRSLEAQVCDRQLQTNVLFIGNLDRETELLDCYRAADVKVFASRTETQGLVLLEAMALGVAVVSTAVMGTRDVLLPNSGAEVVAENAQEFSDAVIGVLSSPSRRKHMGEIGAAYVQSWSSAAMASRLIGVYQGILAARTPEVVLAAPGVDAA